MKFSVPFNFTMPLQYLKIITYKNPLILINVSKQKNIARCNIRIKLALLIFMDCFEKYIYCDFKSK